MRHALTRTPAPTTPHRGAAHRALFSTILGATLLGAPALAQDGDASQRPGFDVRIDPFTGEEARESLLPPPPPQQDGQDYTVSGMFTRTHGEYLQEAFGYRPSIRAYYGRQAAAELTGEGGDFDFDEYRIESELWAPVDPDSFLILGGNFGARDYQFDGIPTLNDETLFEASAKVGYGRFLDEDLLITATFEPGLYTDFDGTMKSEDWQFLGRATATWRAAERIYLKGGLVVDRTFKNTPLYPTIGANWVFADNWRLDVMVPQHFVLQYTPSAEWVFTGGLLLQGDQYEMGNAGFKSRAVHAQEFRLFLDGVFRVNDNLGLRGRFGGTIAGHYDIDTPGGSDFDGTIEPAVFFELGVDWSF